MSSAPSRPPGQNWRPLVELAIAEDVGSGDVTSALTIPADLQGRARIEARGLAVSDSNEPTRDASASSASTSAAPDRPTAPSPQIREEERDAAGAAYDHAREVYDRIIQDFDR